MEKGEWYARILQDDVLTFSRDEAELAAALLRYSTISLLDLVLFIWKKVAAHPTEPAVKNAYEKLDSSIRSQLDANFRDLSIHIPDQYRLSDPDPGDEEIYRLTFLYDDVASVVRWKCGINALMFPGSLGLQTFAGDASHLALDAASDTIAASPDCADQTISNLSGWEKSFLSSEENIANNQLLTSVIVADSLRKMGVSDKQNPIEVANVFARTEGAFLYLTAEDFTCLSETQMAKSSPLLAFMIREMSYRKARSQDNELERRLAFMEMFAPDYGCRIVDLIRATSEERAKVAILLAKTCTRSFLERLFFLMRTVKEVLEARIEICEWLVANDSDLDDDVIEELEALKRELANLGEKSDLDSTRVHVDEGGLYEWFAVTQVGNATRYVQTVLAEGPRAHFVSMLTIYGSKSKPLVGDEDSSVAINTRIGSEFLLLGIAEETLKAFAEDRTFGLDAYLSRRIRHGTLSGHVTTPITRILKRMTEARDTYQDLHNSENLEGIERLATEWRVYLASELDHMRKNIIQIKSDAHPEGLITADWRLAANIAHLDAMILRVRKRVLEKGAVDIFQDIYAFCWDCMETDLAQLRLFVIRRFYPRAQARLVNLYDSLSTEEQEIVYPYVKEIAKTLGARLLEVCGWFIRPVFRRDRYSLRGLISSTFSLIRELDDRYAFSEEVNMQEDISLNRGGFEIFGDVLFVLIGNAARHAKEDGTVTVSAETFEARPGVVQLDITSELPSGKSFEEVGDRIRSALLVAEAQAIADAAVEEGFSGLRKLIGILNRIRTPDVEHAVIPNEDQGKFTFRVVLPSEIITAQGQA